MVVGKYDSEIGLTSTLATVKLRIGAPAPGFYQYKLECGPMPNVMVALPNTGGALCSTPESLADAHY